MNKRRQGDAQGALPKELERQHLNDVHEVDWMCALHGEMGAARAAVHQDHEIIQLLENVDPNTKRLNTQTLWPS